MNTFDLLNLGYSMPCGVPNFHSLVNKKRQLSSFGSQMIELFGRSQPVNNSAGSARNPQIEKITIQLAGKNCVYTGGMKGERVNQNVYVEYTEDSTEDDPVVRISGEADSGHFDFICHINDINPRNASYAELSALYGHLMKNGAFGSTGGVAVTPSGYEFFGSRDMLKKQDFIAGISDLSVSDRIDPRERANAKYMLQVYQDFIQQGTNEVV